MELLTKIWKKRSDQIRSDRLRNKMAAKFRIDGSSLARDDFADVIINEVISNKVLSYSVSDSNNKLKVIGAK